MSPELPRSVDGIVDCAALARDWGGRMRRREGQGVLPCPSDQFNRATRSRSEFRASSGDSSCFPAGNSH